MRGVAYSKATETVPQGEGWQTQGMRTLTATLVLVLLASACGDSSDTTVPATTTVAPATTTAAPTTTSGPVPLEWPNDVGVSHFGHISAGWDAGPGGWRRPHPGVFSWGFVETFLGNYNWQTTDQMVRVMQQDRVAVLTTLWPFADWDQKMCHSDQPKFQPAFPELGDSFYGPCDIDAYASWLEATVERYDGDGVNDMPGLEYPMRHWEIANEPEMQGSDFTFFQGDPATYLGLLRSSYGAIKAADSSAVVLLGGQAGMFDFMVDYWEPVLKEAHGLFDVGNIHSISRSDTFFSAEYRTFLDGLGHQARPFWITEAEIGDGSLRGRSEEELAQIPFMGSVTSFINGAEVIIIAGAAYGHPRVPQMVRETWEVVVSTVGDFETVTGLTESSARFDMPDRTTVYAIWNGAGLPTEVTGSVLTRRYDGVETILDASQVVSEFPTFVLVD